MNWRKIFPVIYIKISPERLIVQWVGTGISKEVKPVVAVNEKGKGVAVGQQAETAVSASGGKLRLINGFSHPRMVIGDFEAASIAVRLTLGEVLSNKVLIAPVIVLYPADSFDGGLSQIETRALKDLAQSAGAREVYLTDFELSESEMADLNSLRKKLAK